MKVSEVVFRFYANSKHFCRIWGKFAKCGVWISSKVYNYKWFIMNWKLLLWWKPYPSHFHTFSGQSIPQTPTTLRWENRKWHNSRKIKLKPIMRNMKRIMLLGRTRRISNSLDLPQFTCNCGYISHKPQCLAFWWNVCGATFHSDLLIISFYFRK